MGRINLVNLYQGKPVVVGILTDADLPVGHEELVGAGDAALNLNVDQVAVLVDRDQVVPGGCCELLPPACGQAVAQRRVRR
jgi:hypothetical protein